MVSTRRRFLFAVVGYYAVAFLWPHYDSRNGSIEIDLSAQDERFCHQVDFPDPWLPMATSDRHEFGSLVSLRMRQGSQPDEVLVAGYTSDSDPWVTQQKYRVNLDHGNQSLVRVDAATWDSAVDLKWVERTYSDDGVPPGGSFVRTGDVAAEITARMSKERKWVVLQSYTRSWWQSMMRGKSIGAELLTGIALAPFLRVFPNVDPIYLDVYEVSGAVKVASLKGRLYGTPDHINRTGWLGKYFLVPTGPSYEHLVVCDFSKAHAKR